MAESETRPARLQSPPAVLPSKVLLIDDSEADLCALDALLEGLAGSIVRARSGQEALRCLLKDDFAVVVLDLGLNDMNGFDVASLIRKQRRHRTLPLIFLTKCEPERQDLDRAFELGCVDFVTKPVVEAVLRTKVLTFVELQRNRFELERRVLERTAELCRAREAQGRLGAIVATSHDAIFGQSMDGTIDSWNKGAEHLFGYAMEEIVGRPVAVLVPDTLRFEEVQIQARLRSGERIESYETKRQRKDGTVLDVSLTVSPIADAQGRIIGASNVARDITDRRRAEVTAGRLAAIVESSDDAIISKTLDGIITSWNHGAERLFGYRPDEIVGRSILLVIPEDRAGEEKEIIARLVRGERVDHFETVRRRKDGSLVEISLTVSPVKDASGRVIGASKIARDITEQKRSQSALERLAAVVQSTSDAIITKTLDGTITSWNPGAQAIFGYTPEETIGRSVTMLLPPDRIQEERDILDRIGRGERVHHYETLRRRKDGTLLDVSLTISPIRDSRGRIVGASKIARDISAQKRAEAEIRKLNGVLEDRIRERTRSLEETIRELDTFAYSVAHDLRAPLRAVHSFGQLLQEDAAGKLDDHLNGYVNEIIRAGRRMDVLICDLLAYSRLSRQEVTLVPLDLGLIVDKVLSDMKAELVERKAQVRVEGPLPAVLGHAMTLVQAVTNLVSNAAKFVDPATEPRITIRAERANGRVKLWVEDNGIGIAPQHQDRLFKVFERLQPREAYPGTGIGLAIVRRVAERMGGSVGLESASGAGSRFWVELSSATT